MTQLERELAAAIAERDGLREQVERMREALEFAPEPFLYGCTECGGANYGCKCESTKGLTIPLYDHIPVIKDSLITDPVADGCAHCNSPLYAGRKCKNCGTVFDTPSKEKAK